MPTIISRASKATNSYCSNRPARKYAVAVGMLLLVLLLLMHHSSDTPATAADVPSSNGNTRSSRSSSDSTVQVSLAGRWEEIQGTEVVWEAPAGQQPKGLLLTFHGCSHGAIDWWPNSESCTTCIGLPEEVLITRTALARGYAVVAISSRDRKHQRCWAVPHQPGTHTVDTLSVVAVVTELQKRELFRNVPLYAVGASSGGAFALTITAYLGFSAVCSQIMALPGAWYKTFLDSRDSQQQQQQQQQDVHLQPEPPVLFVHMSRDEHTAARVKECTDIRQAKGLTTHVIKVQPQPVTAELLARAPELAGEVGQQLVQLFKKEGVTDAAGMLTNDPRSATWHAVVRNSGVAGLNDIDLTPDESGLSELLNMAYAQHEIIADTTLQMLDWFEQQPVLKASRQ